MSGHFCFLEKRHSSPRERRLNLAQCFSFRFPETNPGLCEINRVLLEP
jgi:hypothetical protein